MSDLEHLRSYVRTRARADLEPLVRRNLDWVYCCARRHLRGDEHLAADVTQAVFLALASKPPNLGSDAAVAGWLYRVTQYAAAGAIRKERRRRRHEEQAAMQRSETQTMSDDQWRELSPVLEELVTRLASKDRDSIILRFYQQCSFAEVGSAMGITEEAARKRVSRAVEKLREMMSRKGKVAPAGAVLAAGILAHATQPAPAAVLGASLGALGSGTASASMLSLTKGAFNMMTLIKVKWAVATIFALAIPIGVVAVLAQVRAPATPAAPIAAAPATLPAQRPATAPAVQVHVVDEQDRPVAGAQVYAIQNLMPTPRQEDMTTAAVGPLTAGADAVAKISGLPAPTSDQMGWQQTFFARVPGKKVGVGRQVYARNAPASMPPPKDVVTIHLVDNSPVSGHAILPDGMQPLGVRAKLLYFILNASAGSPRGTGGMDLFEAKDSQFLSQWPDLFSTPLDAQGNFTLNDIPSQCRGGIAIEGPGIGQAQIALLRPDEKPIEVRLEKEAIVSGTLRFADGSPGAGLTVLLNPDEVVNIVHRGARTMRTDSAGKFRFDGLAQGVYSALVSSSNLGDWVAMPKEGIRVSAGETRSEIEISLEHGVVITGQIISSQGGQPVTGVSITALSVGNVNGHAFASGTSGADGKYSMRLPVGQSKLYVSNPGAGFNPPQNQGQRTITVSAAGTVEGDLTFAMVPAAPPRNNGFAMIRGQVVDGEGKPLARIKIGDSRTEDWNGQKMPISDENAATTDAQGAFQVRVDAGIPHEFYIVTPDSTGRSSSITPRANATESVKITATPRPVLGTISGTVVDPQGKPIVNAVVNGMRITDPDTAITDAQGRFEVPIRRADSTMLISKSGYEIRNWNDIPLNSRDLTFILYPSTRTTMMSGNEALPDSKALIGKPAPQLDVETWAILPGNVPPSLNSGKKTLLLVCDNDERAPARIEQLQLAAAKADAQAIAIFSTYLHEASVKAILKDVKVTCAVAVDRYVPENNYRVNGAMRIALCAERLSRFYLIGADGNIITDNFDPATGK